MTVTKEIKLLNVNKLLEHRLNICQKRRLLRFDIERKCYNHIRLTHPIFSGAVLPTGSKIQEERGRGAVPVFALFS